MSNVYRLVAWVSVGVFAGVLSLPAASSAQDRVQWTTAQPEVSTVTHYVTEAENAAPVRRTHRVARLDGRLATFSPADAALYAVYLETASEVGSLYRVLESVGAPPAWQALRERGETASLGNTTYEWVSLQANGAFSLVADEGRQPGKNYVAIVNSAGHVLSTRPLWRAADDMAGWPGTDEPATP